MAGVGRRPRSRPRRSRHGRASPRRRPRSPQCGRVRSAPAARHGRTLLGRLEHRGTSHRLLLAVGKTRSQRASVLKTMARETRSRSHTHSLNGSSFDPAGARTYLGGASLPTARVIVSRCTPMRRCIARLERRSTKYNRLLSAHCSTPTTNSSSPDNKTRRASETSRTGSDSTPDGPDFNRRRRTSIQAAPTQARATHASDRAGRSSSGRSGRVFVIRFYGVWSSPHRLAATKPRRGLRTPTSSMRRARHVRRG